MDTNRFVITDHQWERMEPQVGREISKPALAYIILENPDDGRNRPIFNANAFRGIPDTSKHHQCPESTQCGRVLVSHVFPEVL